MIEKDYILLILNCDKYKYKAEIQKKIWLNTLTNNIKYFHIIGNSNICDNNEYIFDNSKNILYVNTPDDYLSLPNKIITAIKAINENYKYKYIFKTDDDQILIKDNFFETLIGVLNNNITHYGGLIIGVNDHISNYWLVHDCLPKDILLKKTTYCNGRFYLLSNKLIADLLLNIDKIKTHIIEDHAIGYYIPDKYKNDVLKINTDSIFIDFEKYIKIKESQLYKNDNRFKLFSNIS